jgi:hypothetical protein
MDTARVRARARVFEKSSSACWTLAACHDRPPAGAGGIGQHCRDGHGGGQSRPRRLRAEAGNVVIGRDPPLAAAALSRRSRARLATCMCRRRQRQPQGACLSMCVCALQSVPFTHGRRTLGICRAPCHRCHWLAAAPPSVERGPTVAEAGDSELSQRARTHAPMHARR